MKTQFYFLFVGIFFLGIVCTSCKTDEPSYLIEENGLSYEINNLISSDIFNILDSLGMPIHTGGNPANIEGTFLVSQPVLLSSNLKDDSVGYEFEGIRILFSGKNNEELKLMAKFSQDSSQADWQESFISGNGNDFSVFSKIKTLNSTGKDSAFSAQIYSGTWSSDGLTDLHMAVVMLDNYNNPDGSYIDVGSARLIFDKDGFSKKIDNE
ncbi:hypothetical protein SAMN05444280_10799 [Tangfeifania diversioriginum]|uniref:Uncharacterized protein n=1 Tax=Tangfeifania diversioriginum TaxID=1168035 RepID=A0A1M6ES18_9BACT|nr:hypothetical protein [Tangfeifania diversioriginum]SHI88247.1 hypothetical protein SAMN05444280_10799 [Tangfeifania diversioriginum]